MGEGEPSRGGSEALLAIDFREGVAGVTVIRLVGVLSPAAVPKVRTVLLKCLADQPTAVVVDLQLAERLGQWDCDVLTEDAVAVAAELVNHVIQVFAIEPVLRLELRRSLLTVAIAHRQVTGTTEEASIDPLSRRILTGIAQTWGTSATQTGTVVWCVLRVPA